MLLLMVVRAGRTAGTPAMDPLLLATAILGLIWNVCALPVYELPKLGIAGPFPLLKVVGFGALGFLPAVVVHSVLRSEHVGHEVLRRAIAVIAYSAGAIASALHLRTWWLGGQLPSVTAMLLLTYTSISLLAPLAVITRGQPGARRALWATALSIFAVSALHLGQLQHGDPSWPVELVGHHASLPLAVAILYQDFPFALADLFLKRALTLLILVTAAFVAVVGLSVGHAGAVAPLQSAGDIGVLVTLWVATALLYPKLRDVTSWFVDAIVLDRPDYTSLRATIGPRAERHDQIPALLDDVCGQLAPALSAKLVRWRQTDDETDSRDRVRPVAVGITIVDIPVAEPPRLSLEISGLTGGRRLLSDDRVALEAIATLVGRRIDAIRLAAERYARQLREQEMAQLATEAELRALQSQMNPHFLFNTLTTIGYLIQTAPDRAFTTLMRLTALLRGVLRLDSELTTLGREVELVEAYLDIERARFEHRLRVHIDVPSRLKIIRLPPLLLQPLVENAVKHGIAPRRQGGEVSVTARIERTTSEPPTLTVTVSDTGAGVSATALRRGRERGVGLRNVERRLVCQYGNAAALSVTSTPGTGTVVTIVMPGEETVTDAGEGARSAS
jgi:two-component system, LytTR family, sensor kinase